LREKGGIDDDDDSKKQAVYLGISQQSDGPKEIGNALCRDHDFSVWSNVTASMHYIGNKKRWVGSNGFTALVSLQPL